MLSCKLVLQAKSIYSREGFTKALEVAFVAFIVDVVVGNLFEFELKVALFLKIFLMSLIDDRI